MFTRLLQAIGIKAVAFIVLGLALLFWANWTHTAIQTLATNKNVIDDLTATIDDLKGEISTYIARKDNLLNDFKGIEQGQVDLLCAARYQQPLIETNPSLPLIKEVTVYRDRLSKCPVVVDQVNTPIDPMGPALQPVSEEVATGVLDNSWKAYCLAVNQEDPVCRPAL